MHFLCIETRAPTGLEPSEPGTSLIDIPVYTIQDFDVTAAAICTVRVNTTCLKSKQRKLYICLSFCGNQKFIYKIKTIQINDGKIAICFKYPVIIIYF